MNKYRYYFDWQESSVYEGIEAKRKNIIAAVEVKQEVVKPNRLDNKNGFHQRIDRITPANIFGWKVAHGFIG